ncbi:TPA: transposase [Escherichia coli]|nr:transposase [Escherichia coli]UMT09284.1 hypothetical protein AOY62_12415 [Escherichia coli]HAW1750955.1 transposase [Escherichia coli]
MNEAREITESWLNEYNSERPHQSLNNLTPEEYRLMAEKPELSKSAWNKNGCAYTITILHALPVNQTPFLQNFQALYKLKVVQN